ncbi:MAG TPA: DUF2784 domain-containing protein [Woeseiaceae bacterium]|jgi:hypothetical protein|nr:DUF2784 domain-containing protein [Woeseiaceae bacterium]
MADRIAADVVMIVHLIFVLFAVFGGLLVLRFPALALAHVPALGWGFWIEAAGGICPLTPLENSLRRRAGEAGYASGFMEHYVYPLLYPPGLTRGAQVWLAALLLVFNLAIYARLLLRGRRDHP